MGEYTYHIYVSAIKNKREKREKFNLGEMKFSVPLALGDKASISYSDEGRNSLCLGKVREIMHYPIKNNDRNEEGGNLQREVNAEVNAIFYNDSPEDYSDIKGLASILAKNAPHIPLDSRYPLPHERPKV